MQRQPILEGLIYRAGAAAWDCRKVPHQTRHTAGAAPLESDSKGTGLDQVLFGSESIEVPAVARGAKASRGSFSFIIFTNLAKPAEFETQTLGLSRRFRTCCTCWTTARKSRMGTWARPAAYGASVASMRLPQVPDSSVQAVIGRVARVIEKAFLRLPIEVEPGGYFKQVSIYAYIVQGYPKLSVISALA